MGIDKRIIGRRELLKAAMGGTVVLLAAACGQAASAPTAKPAEAAKPAAPAAVPAVSPAAAKPAAGTIAAGPERFTPDPAILEAAKREGKLVLYSGNSADVVAKIMDAFKARFPEIDSAGTLVEQEGPLMAKVMAENQAGQTQADIFYSSTDTLLFDLQRRNLLLEYASPEYQYYDPKYLSRPATFFGPAKTSLVGIAWNTDVIKDADAPKGWRDLLDPRFKGKISAFNSTASSPFFAWYLLPQVLGADYWDRITEQQIKPYQSSAQILDALASGETPVAMQFSNTRLITILEKNLPVKALWPAEGVPSYNSVQGILAKAPHPNAAKLFHDWSFSREGMTVAGDISGQLALRSDVPVPPSQPDISKVNLLVPTDQEDYVKAYTAFKPAWDKIVGMK